jgi:hypothetical protein
MEHKIRHFLIYSTLFGLLCIFAGVALQSECKEGDKLMFFALLMKQVGSGILAGGAVGLVFEYVTSKELVWNTTKELARKIQEASASQQRLLDTLEERVNKVGEEIVMTSGMLKNATSVGIQAVYSGREPSFHSDVARAIRDSQDSIRILGISLADLCGYWGGKSEPHEAIEYVMTSQKVKLQILFADPEGEGLKTRAKFEHPGIPYLDTRAFKQTSAKINEMITIADKYLSEGGVEIKLYSDTPTCFLVLTDSLAFIEQYTYASRGGNNVLFAIKNNTPLYRLHSDHFEALMRDARDAKMYSRGLMPSS